MRRLSVLLVIAGVGGCAENPENPADPVPVAPETVRIELPAIEVAAGGEIPSLCQSFTLGNEEPLPVNAVHMEAGPAWHHSNWFFVPEDVYEGPDGTWDCGERGFDTLGAGLSGGVVFAQSTQARAESQELGPGAAIEIPPRSRIVGEVHLINASEADVSTSIALELVPLAPEEFETPLYTATLVYFDLAIPPLQRSRFGAGCDLSLAYGAPLDLRVHYVLPHYHGLGESLRLEAVGGGADGQVIYENAAAIGEPLGGRLDPAFDLTGASGMRFSCTFDNRGETTVEWGLKDGEMCVALAFVDGPFKWLAGVQGGTAPATSPDGVDTFEGPCEVLAFPAQ